MKWLNDSKWLLSALVALLIASAGHPVGAQETEGQQATVAALQTQAAANGAARIIVRLAVDAPPADLLTTSQAVATQKSRIADKGSALLDRIHIAHKKAVRRFAHLPLVAMELTPEGLEAVLAAPETVEVFEDVSVPPTLAQSVPLIGGAAAFAAGFTGSGQTVAVLDTGVDGNHPFLAGKVVSEACFSTTSSQSNTTTLCPNGQSTQLGAGAAAPCVGICSHGTHVAGIAAGNGAGSTGVAKDATILAIQVFSRFNSASSCPNGPPCLRAFTSDIVAGLDRVYDLRSTFSIASANMSLGGGRFTSPCDSGSAYKGAIDLLRGAGIATVIASGNDGFTDAIGSPGCVSTAVTVGSTTKSDTVSSFSNSASFLDLLAPGSSIVSSVPGTGFANFNGTSMATPHVAGAWAVIKSKDPSASVDAVLNALKSTGVSILDNRNNLTHPRIRVDTALAQVGAAVPSAQLSVAPADGLSASGNQGGPFGPTSSKLYTLTNTGGATLSYLVQKTGDWLALSQSDGSLAPAASTTITVSLTALATTLQPGIHLGSASFVNATNGLGNTSRAITLTVASGPGANDKFDDAILLSSASGTTTGTNTGASKEPGEPPLHAGNAGGRSVWWRWVAPTAGTFSVDTFGSNFNTLLAAYTGNSVNGLAQVAANDDSGGVQSKVEFPVVAGQTYHMAVDGFGGASGSITFNWLFESAAQPPGDLSVTPIGGLAASGSSGGPFSPSSRVYTLTNTSATTIAFTVSKSGDVSGRYVDLSTTSGSLPAGASTTVTVSVGSEANALAAGGYAALVSFNTVVRPVTLSIRGTLEFAGVEDFDGSPPPRFAAAGAKTGELVFVGRLCNGDAVVNAAAFNPGDIAIIRRGACEFHEKLLNAQALSAGAGVIANNVAGEGTINWNAPDEGITIPALFIGTADGDVLEATPTGRFGTVDSNSVVVNVLPNDNFVSGIPLTGSAGSTTGSNVGATKEAGEPNHAGDSGGSSVWWQWTAPANGSFEFNTLGSNFDTLLAAYTGNSVNGLAQVAANDDAGATSQSRIIISAQAGQTYHIGVDGFRGASGSIALAFSPFSGAGVANDSFANRIRLDRAGRVEFPGFEDSEGAPPPRFASVGAVTAELVFVGQLCTGDLVANAAAFDAGDIAVIRRGICPFSEKLLNAQALGAAAGVIANNVPGEAAISNWTAPNGAINIPALFISTADGDVLESRPTGAVGTVDSSSVVVKLIVATGSSVGATKQSGEPQHAGNQGGTSVWWTWTASVSGQVAISTFGSSYDTLLAVYTGSSVTGLSTVVANDDGGPSSLQSVVSFAAKAGQRYQIAVDGFDASSGSVKLTIAAPDDLSWLVPIQMLLLE
jgi:subtilisin family serine protease